MPSRKQRRRQAKEQRHEHEFVWVDSDGRPLEEQPDGAAADSKQRNGNAPATQQKAKAQPQKSGRRTPQPPSWPRAAKRAAILGVVVFVIFSFGASRSHRGYVTAIIPAVIYTALFIPFTYVIDRYAYNRYLTKTQQGGAPAKKQPPKKR